MRQVLWWLIGGSRGGRNRLRIVLTLDERPMNANQLSNDLELDYKTVQHHLELLCDNGVLTTMGDGYGKMYFLTESMESNMDLLADVAEKADLADVITTETNDRGSAAGGEDPGTNGDEAELDPEDGGKLT